VIGAIPEVGDKIETGSLRFEIVDLDGRRPSLGVARDGNGRAVPRHRYVPEFSGDGYEQERDLAQPERRSAGRY